MSDDYPSPVFKRKLETALSQIDQAIQGLAIVADGCIAIYDHDWPVRWVEALGADGVYRRVSVEPTWTDQSSEDPPFAFRVVICAWKHDGQSPRGWHHIRGTLEMLPAGFSEQLAMLESCWSEVAKIGVNDLTKGSPET